jgi:hypothetical protein
MAPSKVVLPDTGKGPRFVHIARDGDLLARILGHEDVHLRILQIVLPQLVCDQLFCLIGREAGDLDRGPSGT